jgi:hypothetical protein
MSAHEMPMMSAWSVEAIVGSDTMKIREAKPERNCPMIALGGGGRRAASLRECILARIGDGDNGPLRATARGRLCRITRIRVEFPGSRAPLAAVENHPERSGSGAGQEDQARANPGSAS